MCGNTAQNKAHTSEPVRLSQCEHQGKCWSFTGPLQTLNW
uniref:Uncharacterized protein n=1 Tax=Anguilla anguilla TaxID=7936 RepID=A0A0E9V4C4_ANGAN